MPQPPDNVPQKNQRVFRIFYLTAIFLLLAAIAITFIQKSQESAIALTGAQGGEVQQHVQTAQYWAKVSFATVALAVLSLGIAVWYYEKQRWVWGPVLVLLFFFVALQLMMV